MGIHSHGACFRLCAVLPKINLSALQESSIILSKNSQDSTKAQPVIYGLIISHTISACITKNNRQRIMIKKDSQTNGALSCTLIIPTRDQLSFLQTCINSVLKSIHDYNVQIIIVDNNSEEDATKNYLASLREDSRFKILIWNKPFNFSAINNFAAKYSSSDVLCFLNNDIDVIDESWLEKLLPIATRNDVGAVGCVLQYPDATIQHGGSALNEILVAKHIAVGKPSNYLSQQSISEPFAVEAVTAACMFIRKSLFTRLGGFNATNLSVTFSDVDLCLRIREKGLPILLHPDVILTHHESISRKSDEENINRIRAIREKAYMYYRWRHKLTNCLHEAEVGEKQLEKAKQNSALKLTLEEIIEQATDNLFDEVSDAISFDNRLSLRPPSDEVQQYFHDLELEVTKLKEVKAHANQLEEAHRLIESSIFWRMTAPLRWLKESLMAIAR